MTDVELSKKQREVEAYLLQAILDANNETKQGAAVTNYYHFKLALEDQNCCNQKTDELKK